ncbi:MAG: hypothetical protein JSS65_09910 [Armatimonadetes bacterium]|nr:hypothetical protein [Armatimonadota bacterium]
MRRIVAGLVIALVAGCGGSSGGGSTGVAVSDSRRAAVIQSVNTRFAQIVAAGGDVDTQNSTIAAEMAAMPEFEETGADVDFDCAWGRFTDGRLLIIGNHPFPEGSRSPSRAVEGGRAFIAKSTKARLGHMFGQGFTQLQQPIDDMSRYLQVDGSYQIQSPPEGSLRLSDYRSVAGDGFVYFNAHGGEGKTKSGDTVFTMVSSTLHNEATDAIPEIKADWDADRLVYYTGNAGTSNGHTTYATWYGINHKFIRDYMSFGQHAIVLLNVCYTANPHVDIGRFRQAILDKGAGVVLGWSQLCESSAAFDAVKYFVDRLVAKNEFQPENPQERAFMVTQILSDMHLKGKDTNGVNGNARSDLKAFFGSGVGNVGLRPSIKYMLRDELNDYLVLHGQFGDELGVVKVNNVPATLVGGWGNDVLITRIPESGPGSDGPVWIEVNGKKSKERFLTSWRGTFTYHYADSQPNSTLVEDSTAHFHIRMDVDQYRETAGGQLLDQDPKVFYAAGDSTLKWSCGGGITDEQGTYLSWTGHNTPPFVRHNILGPSNAWTVNGVYDPATKFLVFAVQNGGIKTVHRRGQADITEAGTGGTYQMHLFADFSGPPSDVSQGDATAKFSALTVTWPPPNTFR